MVLYPPAPNIGAIADAVIAIRHDSMGTLVLDRFSDAPIRLFARRSNTTVTSAMLVDQYSVKGVRGHLLRPELHGQSADREARPPDRLRRSNGTRIIRLPGGAFRGEITDEITSDAERVRGGSTMPGTMQCDHHGDRGMACASTLNAVAVAAPRWRE